ncbi:MAG TPA: GWxTD domain-containing protein [Gemmatimonadales bacterium]|nr:GWxTD domain-containing protein [Gemmatimonadales bacterium]
MRRLGEVALFATVAAGCGSWQRVGTEPRPQPGTALPSLADAGTLYRRMGFLVAGAPLPFVAAVRYLADATPDSTLAVFALSLANHSLSFQRDGNVFVAQYHVEVAFRADTAPARQIASDETVRIRTFQETLRADESVIYQQFVGLRPGVYTVTVTVRDRNAPAATRQERVDTVPRFAGRGLSSPLPVYEGAGRTSVAGPPKLLVNPRATLPFGGDTLRFYVEAYGMPPGARLTARALDQTGTAVAQDTVALAGDGRFAATQFTFRPGDLPVGEGSVEVAAIVPGGNSLPAVRAPFVVSFSDQWAITNFDEMINLLRYFDRQDWVDSLRKASAAERPGVWRRFYKATDPVALTPENEALDQYFRRVQVANERFRESGDPGWMTDRGEVFITLGDPDDVYDASSDVSRSGVRLIRWTFTSLRLTLFFQDQTGFGRFRLTPMSRAEFQRVLARVRRAQ